MQLIIFSILQLSRSTLFEASVANSPLVAVDTSGPAEETSKSSTPDTSSDGIAHVNLQKHTSGSVDASTSVSGPDDSEVGSVAVVDDFCSGDNSESIMDYYVLREGYDFSKEFRLKLNWMCSIDVDEMSDRFSEERSHILGLLRVIEESVDDHVYSLEDVDSILDEENVRKVRGGLIDRHEILESLNQAMDILWSTKGSQNESEIVFRQSIAMYIVEHAAEFEDKFGWVGEYCYDDKRPLIVSPSSRFSGADYGSSMEFFKILDALKFFESSVAPIVDELTAYIYTRRIKIKTCWEAVDALNVLVQATTDFTFFRLPSRDLISSLHKSLHYLVNYEDAIFM